MDIVVRGFYNPEEQRAIGRGESEPIEGLSEGALSAQVDERQNQLIERRRVDEPFTPELNESLLAESKALEEDKRIVRGAAKQLKSWRAEHAFEDPNIS